MGTQLNHSTHLWTGFGSCAVCSGRIRVLSQRSGKYYECANRQRGTAICANTTIVKEKAFDEARKRALMTVLNPDVISAAVTKALKRIRAETEKRER